MSFDKTTELFYDIAKNLRGISEEKANKLARVCELWTQCRKGLKGFEKLYRLCVEVGVDITTEQRVVHLDPIGGNVCVAKGQEFFVYNFDDVSEAIKRFYDLATGYDSEANMLKKRSAKQDGRSKASNASARRLRCNANV